MKKVLIISMLCIMPVCTFAQRQLKSSTAVISNTSDEITSKVNNISNSEVAAPQKSKTVYYGSKQGGFAFSVNANPFLNYVGNMFNGTSGNSFSDFEGVSNNMFNGHTITGKYMMKDNVAFSAGFGFNNNYSTSYKFYDKDDIELHTNKDRQATTAFMAKFGFEYLLRPGARLQPTLGVGVVYVHENSWNYTKVLEAIDNVQDKKVYDYYGAPVNKLGLIADVGVEYFFCSNISLGATVSLGIAKQWKKSTRDTDIKGQDDYNKYTSNNIKLMSGSTAAGANVSLNFYF